MIYVYIALFVTSCIACALIGKSKGQQQAWDAICVIINEASCLHMDKMDDICTELAREMVARGVESMSDQEIRQFIAQRAYRGHDRL